MAERDSRFEYEVVVDFVSGGEIANLLKGYVTAQGKRIRFSGVAYGRFGGQNVSPRLSPSAQKKVRELFGDLEGFEEDLQLRLVNGEFEIRAKEGTKSPTTGEETR
jgi:hypothetical protein